jgi:hypothetical protein
MVAPPLSLGAVKVSVMLFPLVTAVTSEGALGTPAGITEVVAED